MTSKSKQKGSAFEREIVKLHLGMDIKAKRVPLSGADANYKGDVDIMNGRFIGECKKRKEGTGFKVIENWLGNHDMLFLRRNRAEPMVVLPWDTYVILMQSVNNE